MKMNFGIKHLKMVDLKPKKPTAQLERQVDIKALFLTNLPQLEELELIVDVEVLETNRDIEGYKSQLNFRKLSEYIDLSFNL